MFPYEIVRLTHAILPDVASAYESNGLFNPAATRLHDGSIAVYPRMDGQDGRARIGMAMWDARTNRLSGRTLALEPSRFWEFGRKHGGVEDPRVVFIPVLGKFVMTYVAFGPVGPKLAVAVSEDGRSWGKLGPVHFRVESDPDVDLNLYHNKNGSFFPEPIMSPSGEMSLAFIHRPKWNLDFIRQGLGATRPLGVHRSESMWVSYAPLKNLTEDASRMLELREHSEILVPKREDENIKIGLGAPPIRVPEGWLLIYHGVSAAVQGEHLTYSHCAMGAILDAEDPTVELSRSDNPLLTPSTLAEVNGNVPNVVFPAGIVQEGDGRFVLFYGAGDLAIGTATVSKLAV
ncbi:glycosidase [Frigoribacterium sp. SL97]|uniref:glycoside hydrolase family 130 protein n=1 Tax=Frigoribacterium sp. SL97 TaxID=2994664 RepID=UPI00226FEDE2|nr:glycosidase [Frigoribacterium sp. SL97]WAC50399.1 glycosidase [Frigoribacterium sp. SL97]